MIETIEDLQKLVINGESNWKQYGHVSTQELDGLILFNYSPMAQIEGIWNFFERVSRGLIINRLTGEIVARPFDKFYNWLEGGRRSDAQIVNVTEKMDGSLGITYIVDSEWRVATRGSMKSEQAIWATAYLRQHHDYESPPHELTFLFEIIYPENRVVVDYHGREDLVLLAIRNRFTGDYLPFADVQRYASDYGLSLVPTHSFRDIALLIERCTTLNIEHEGFVVEFADGQRFKFKGDRYLELHRLISALTYKNVLKAMAAGSIQQVLEVVPDEFLTEVRGWIAEINGEIVRIVNEVENAYDDAPKETRKDFALWIQKYHKALMPYLFGRLDNKPLEPMIYKWLESVRTDRRILTEEAG